MACSASRAKAARCGTIPGTGPLLPCWKAKSTNGYAFKDADGLSDGVRSLSATAGPAGKGKLALSASNNSVKDQIGMPTGLSDALAGSTSATAQVHTGTADCYTADLANVKTASATEFKASAP